MTESCASCGGTEQGSKRGAVKDLIRTLTAQNPQIEKNIFRSVENVNLDTVIAYKQGRTRHHFLDGQLCIGTAIEKTTARPPKKVLTLSD